jgi:hypothetical protein
MGFVVEATIELADGAKLPGFITPSLDAGDLGTQQPQIFIGEYRFGVSWLLPRRRGNHQDRALSVFVQCLAK